MSLGSFVLDHLPVHRRYAGCIFLPISIGKHIDRSAGKFCSYYSRQNGCMACNDHRTADRLYHYDNGFVYFQPSSVKKIYPVILRLSCLYLGDHSRPSIRFWYEPGPIIRQCITIRYMDSLLDLCAYPNSRHVTGGGNIFICST